MSLANRGAFDSTSAAGAMSMRDVRYHSIIGRILGGSGTSPLYVPEPTLQTTLQTSAGASLVAPGAIGELRRLTGLTWELLARVCNVSRRSLHFWASGKRMASGNEEHLQRLLSVVRRIDRGSARENRIALVAAGDDGRFPCDLLASGEYEQVVTLLGLGQAQRTSPPKIAKEARGARAPRPPEQLVGALHDRIHPTSGRLRSATKVALPRRK